MTAGLTIPYAEGTLADVGTSLLAALGIPVVEGRVTA